MSRTRNSKEKSPSEEQTLAEEPIQVLVSAHAQIAKVNDFPLYSDRFRYLSGVALTPFRASTQQPHASQLQWWKHIASTLPSPLLYPSHTVSASLHPQLPLPPTQSDTVAMAILSVLDLHRLACAGTATPPSLSLPQRPVPLKTVTADAVAQLVGHNLTARGYGRPQLEQKDTTFTDCSDRVPCTDDAVSLTLTGHYHSTHINVCCGRFYYRLEVLDDAQGLLRSRTELARDITAITNDAQQREAAALYHRNISPAAAADLRGMYALFARMSAVDDATAADLHRRLAQEGEVNENTLSSLQSALFTVVLDGPLAADERTMHSQWLHSGLSLYFDPSARGAFCLRAHGTLVDAQTTRMVAEEVAAGLSKWFTSPLFVAQLASRTQQSNATALKTTAGFLPAVAFEKPNLHGQRVGSRAAALELWLPEKHRTALHPYVEMISAPHWAAQPSLAKFGTAALGLLNLLIACEAVLFDEGPPRRPRVCLVVQDATTKVPRSVPLYTAETEALIQYIRAPQARALADTQRRLRDAALLSLHEVLALSDAASEGDVARMSEMDICISAQLLPWLQDCDGAPYRVQHCLSFLGAPARMFVDLTLQQTRVRKDPQLGDGRIVAIHVASAVGQEAFTNAVKMSAEAGLQGLASL